MDELPEGLFFGVGEHQRSKLGEIVLANLLPFLCAATLPDGRVDNVPVIEVISGVAPGEYLRRLDAK